MTVTPKMAARSLIAIWDRIEELKSDFQSTEQRVAIIKPYHEEFRKRIETLRDSLEEEEEG